MAIKGNQSAVPTPDANARRMVLVQLRGALPDPATTSQTARTITTRVENLTGCKAGAVNVFPRFGQFAIEATPAMIAQFSHEPEVETVMDETNSPVTLK